MKVLKSLLILGTLLGSITARANDYALLETYPLLNDMKMVKKEKQALQSIRTMIATGSNNHEDLKEKSRHIVFLLKGLKEGDSQLGLQGTELKRIRLQIKQIEVLWNEKQALFAAALNSRIYRDQAYTAIDELTQQFNKLHAFYNQSYTRYKKNTVMKSLVKSYMHTYIQQEQRYALNTIR
jgi:hypothetical protein